MFEQRITRTFAPDLAATKAEAVTAWALPGERDPRFDIVVSRDGGTVSVDVTAQSPLSLAVAVQAIESML